MSWATVRVEGRPEECPRVSWTSVYVAEQLDARTAEAHLEYCFSPSSLPAGGGTDHFSVLCWGQGLGSGAGVKGEGEMLLSGC